MEHPAITANYDYMATVKKITRGVSYLPPVKALNDWFVYAFKSSDLDQVDRFPTLSQVGAPNEKAEVLKSPQRTEEIFALPCLRLDLKTKHVQEEKLPENGDPRPVVDCTFVTGKSIKIRIKFKRARKNCQVRLYRHIQ